MKKSISGFTLVELLIVTAVIAIIAAISVVAYAGLQDRTADAAVRADLAVIAKKFEHIKIQTGRYPAAYAELPTDIKLTQAAYDGSRNNAYLCINTIDDTYAFTASGKNKKSYALVSNAGVQIVAGNSGSSTCALVGTTWGVQGRMFDNSIAELHLFGQPLGTDSK